MTFSNHFFILNTYSSSVGPTLPYSMLNIAVYTHRPFAGVVTLSKTLVSHDTSALPADVSQSEDTRFIPISRSPPYFPRLSTGKTLSLLNLKRELHSWAKNYT